MRVEEKVCVCEEWWSLLIVKSGVEDVTSNNTRDPTRAFKLPDRADNSAHA